MVAASHGSKPNSPFRNHRSREHAQGWRIHGALAELPKLAHDYACAWLAQRLAIPKAAQLRTGYLDMNHRKTTTAPTLRMRVPGAILCLGALFIVPRPAQSQTQQASPLPLSGRAGQSGSVIAVEAPIPGTTTSVDTINPTVQTQGPFTGSASSTANLPFSGKLSLREAIARGLHYNLGAVGQSNAVRQAQGQSQVARSALLPNVSGYLAETLQQVSLGAEGLQSRKSHARS